MALGKKTGGRVKGTPNKTTLAVAAQLEAIGCDPIEGMARIAMDINTPIEVRAKLCRRNTLATRGIVVSQETIRQWV